MRILHVSDSNLGAVPEGIEARRLDVWDGFRHAVQTAVRHRVDALVHAGPLVHEDVTDDALLLSLERELAPARAAGIEVVTLDAGPLDLRQVDARVLGPGDAVDVGRVAFTADAAMRVAGPSVLVACGAVDGVRGSGVREPVFDPDELVRLPFTYIALGGRHVVQPVQPNACYSGATARTERFDTSPVGGLVVEIGDHTGQLLAVQRVTWPDRPVVSMVVEGLGLGCDALAHVVLDRFLELAGRRLDGFDTEGAPMVHVKVRNAAASFDEVEEVVPMLRWHATHGGPLFTRFDWSGPGGFRRIELRGGEVAVR